MEMDDEGFWYPEINSNLCINCGLCNEVCPIENSQKSNNIIQEAYACYCLVKDVQMRSSSGGLFSLIAKKAIENSGTVFGAGFDSNLVLKTYGINDEDKITQLCGAKYVQSRIEYAYKEIKKMINSGKKVVFVGTPCQVAGLSSYLRGSYTDNILLVDFICHGVPSPALWKAYVGYREKEDCGLMITAQFRSKRRSWRQYYAVYKYKNKIISVHRNDDPYLQSFLKNYSLRPSCYNCCFKGSDRMSDITLGDFWMVNQFVSGMDNGKGTSLVLIHSPKGKAVFTDIAKQMRSLAVPFDKVTDCNLPLISSAPCPVDRKVFFETVENYGWGEIAKSWFPKRMLNTRIKDDATNLKQILSNTYYSIRGRR